LLSVVDSFRPFWVSLIEARGGDCLQYRNNLFRF
jgi:hypothetical protein